MGRGGVRQQEAKQHMPLQIRYKESNQQEGNCVLLITPNMVLLLPGCATQAHTHFVGMMTGPISNSLRRQAAQHAMRMLS